jgi:CRISPR-associated protein Csc1
MNIYECIITLHENTFFSSREVNNFYQTEALIGNYALTYAFRFVEAPYNNTRIMYKEHLQSLNKRGIYITPAKAVGKTHFAISQFNATSETYWSRVEQNAITTDVFAKVGKSKKARAANLPQIGYIKMLGIGSEFRCYVLSESDVIIPSYLRLGKFMSKAKLEVRHFAASASPSREAYTSHTLLNPVDLPEVIEVGLYDLYSVHPVPLIDNARLESLVYAFDEHKKLPVGMRFGVEGLAS